MRFMNARGLVVAVILIGSLAAATAQAQGSRHLAPGFTARPSASKLVLVPMDIELFSLSAGGVAEPRADWTEAAQKNFKGGLQAKQALLGNQVTELGEKEMDDLAQINALHGAVAEAVFLHHMSGFKLPTKNDVLDWTLGDAVEPLRAKSGADYALFFWVRDSYASPERKAAMLALAMLGVGISGGIQVGYASLVDLRTGRVVWFNNLARMTGDLRESKAAEETVDSLLRGFPAVQ
jgi:hypothetical protein